MLQNIHDKAKGWFAYAIIIFISIPFALFGINSYLGGSDSLVAATVNGEEITAQSVQNAVLKQRQRLAQMFGGKLPPGFSDDTLKKEALEQSVNQLLLRQLAKNNGFRASNQEVYDYISEIPSFQKNGKFDVKTYELLLNSQRRTKAGFEAEVREALSNEQFSRSIAESAFINHEEASRLKKLQDQKRSFGTYTLKIDAQKTGLKIEADEIKKYYDSMPSAFMTDEKVKLSYIVLNEADLHKEVLVDDDKLQAYYDENSDRYRVPEQRKVAHILVKIDTTLPPAESLKKAQDKAQKLYEQIKSGGKTFEELASTKSDDEIAAKKAGDIGFIEKGDMGPVFEKVAFALQKDAVSKPVRTEAGIEIIKRLDLKPGRQKTFTEAKSDVEAAYRKEQAEKLFVENSDKLQTLAFENDSSLDDASTAVGVAIKSTGWITRKGSKSAKDDNNKLNLENAPKVLEAAFSDDVLTQGKNSDLLEISPGIDVVVRLQDHQDASRRPLEEVAERVKSKLIETKARKLTLQKGESLLSKVQKTGWSVLDSMGISKDQIINHAEITRNNTKLASQIIEIVFKMNKPLDGKETFANTLLPNGDYVLIGLNAVLDGKSEVDAKDRKAFDSYMGSREQASVLKALRERAEVKLFPENIE